MYESRGKSRKQKNVKKKNLIAACIFGALFLLLILLIKTVDVTPSGAAGTDIGLSAINNWFHNLTGVSMTLYTITDIVGLTAIATVGIFGVAGLVEWIRRKELLKVDREILAMGVLFLTLFFIYIFFQFVVVNYRPVLMPGSLEPEPSFPSSHTIMAWTVMCSIIMVIDKYVKSKKWCKVIRIVAVIVMVLMLVGRLACGVHWLTDIMGAIIMSIMLLEFFYVGLG